jgi:hypothetical protein
MRDMSYQHADPLKRMRLERTADLMKSYKTEVNSSDIRWLSKVRDAAVRVERRVATMLDEHARADTILTSLRRMRQEAEQAHRRIARFSSHERQPPRPRLDERRANRITRDLDEIESFVRQTKRLDEAGAEVMEAMGLSMWKERWRIYELWVLCFICLWLAARSDTIDPLGRIRDGRWTLKFTRDAKPVLACGFNGRWIDIFYQYFERGEDQANMPDIAVQERATGSWLAIVDPKMGETYRQRDMAAICLRYAQAFQAGASVIASYFPDKPSVGATRRRARSDYLQRLEAWDHDGNERGSLGRLSGDQHPPGDKEGGHFGGRFQLHDRLPRRHSECHPTHGQERSGYRPLGVHRRIV